MGQMPAAFVPFLRLGIQAGIHIDMEEPDSDESGLGFKFIWFTRFIEMGDRSTFAVCIHYVAAHTPPTPLPYHAWQNQGTGTHISVYENMASPSAFGYTPNCSTRHLITS